MTRPGHPVSSPRTASRRNRGLGVGDDGRGGFGNNCDLAPDGQRFLMLKDETTTNAADPFTGLMQIHVVLNWHKEVLEWVPVP